MKTKFFSQKPVYLVALVILLAASLLVGSLATGNQPASAQSVDDPVAPVAPVDLAAPEGEFWCTISNVAVYGNRIHVYCPASVGVIDYFAYPLTSAEESRQANRFLVILNTALSLGKRVYVYYDSSFKSNPPGCATANCRLLTGLLIEP